MDPKYTELLVDVLIGAVIAAIVIALVVLGAGAEPTFIYQAF